MTIPPPPRAPLAVSWRARVVVVLLAAIFSAASFCLLTSLGQPIVLRVGPADHAYTDGFRRDAPRATSRRWAKRMAHIRLPFRILRPSLVVLEGARPGFDPAWIELGQEDGPRESCFVGPSTAALALRAIPASSLRLFVRAGTEQRRSLEVSLLTLRPEAPAAVIPETRILVRAALAAALLAAAFLAVGFSGRVSLGWALAVLAVPLCLAGLADPLAGVHLARKAALLAAMVAGGAALLPRERAKRWLPVLALAIMARGVVFHPAYDYKDIETHHKVARVAARKGALELWRRMPHYQGRFDLGRASTGAGYRPFPYPPTFHTLVGLLPFPDPEDAMKLLGIASQGLAVLLVMALAAGVAGPGLPELAAGLLAAFFPPDVLELLRASYPALLGHALDLAIVAFLARRWPRLRSPGGILALALALAGAALTYNAAPVHFAVFLPLLLAVASWPPPLSGRLGLVLAAGIGAALSLVYYGAHLRWTLGQAREAHALAVVGMTLGERLAPALALPALVGTPHLLAAAAGLVVALRRRWPGPGARVLLAWSLYPLGILAPFFLAPEPFRYFRAFYFAYPLFPLLAAALCLASRRAGAFVAALLLAVSLYEISTFATTFFRAGG